MGCGLAKSAATESREWQFCTQNSPKQNCEKEFRTQNSSSGIARRNSARGTAPNRIARRNSARGTAPNRIARRNSARGTAITKNGTGIPHAELSLQKMEQGNSHAEWLRRWPLFSVGSVLPPERLCEEHQDAEELKPPHEHKRRAKPLSCHGQHAP